MAAFDLNLPRDVPWERIATSVNMLDRAQAGSTGSVIFHSSTPNVWKPSLAVFAYVVPEEDSKDYPGRRIVFLRIPVTLTGIRPRILRQVPGFEILPAAAGLALEFEASTPYLPCYGAMVHVAVYPMPVPNDHDWRKYPYIMDMEPKRREVFQAVTSTQLYLEDALNKVGFNKSAASETNTQAGFKFGTSGGQAEGVSIPLTGGYNSSTGVIERQGLQTNVDWSREKRESLSYTSQINQIYQVEVGYHIGNNRVFLTVQPRPGLDEREFVILNGPRKVEGIQDVILVVNAPADLKGFCVYAKVESAHIYEYYENAAPDKGTLLIVSNEASACMPFGPEASPPKTKLPELVKANRGKSKTNLFEKNVPDFPYEVDLPIVLEREVPPLPRPRARVKASSLLASYNHYIEDNVVRPMLNGLDSIERYPRPVPFSHTRAARETLLRILGRLPAQDGRNIRFSDTPGMPQQLQRELSELGLKTLKDLLNARADIKRKGKRIEIEQLRSQVLDKLF